MQTREIEQGHLAKPATGTHPGVVMIPDVWGLADHTRDLAGRLAGDGFAVLAIDPYRKTGRRELASPADAMAWIRELPDPLMLETIQEARDRLAEEPGVDATRIAITGFCMGGQYAILGACGGRGFSACISFYGMLRYEPDLDPERKPRQPLDAIADLPCRFLGLYGEDDHLIPVADVREAETRLATTGRPWEIELYPGAGHAFLNDTRPDLYRPEAAADAWSRLLACLRQMGGDGS